MPERPVRAVRGCEVNIGVVGAGGVGKTTVAALLARAWSRRGARVVAIDADCNPNLGISLGVPGEQAAALPLLPRAVQAGGAGDAPPPAATLLAEYACPTPGGVLLLTAMRIDVAGAGGTCANHSTVRRLLSEDVGADATIVDMQAGLEHLSRAGGTLAPVDVLLVVMEPSRKSVVTAARTHPLAQALGIHLVYGLGNKLRIPGDGELLDAGAPDLPMAGMLPYEAEIAAAERDGSPIPEVPAIAERVERVIDRLQWVTARR